MPAAWRDDKLAEKWRKVRTVRRVVTGALEIERAQKRIGSSLEAHPIVHVSNAELFEAVVDVDLAEVCITSAATLVNDEGPADAFRLPDVAGVAVVPNLAEGTKCARSWKILTTIGADPRIIRTSRRATPRRCANGKPCARRRSRCARAILCGPLTRFGLAVAAIACLLDQASKLYLLFVFDLAANPVRARPVLRFRADPQYRHQLRPVPDARRARPMGAARLQGGWRWLLLWVWLARARDRLTALALGLIIGGAVGNAIDRLAYGWVVDFVFFHVSTGSWRFNWYVFNLADVAIVAGVIGLLYESLVGDRAAKAP